MKLTEHLPLTGSLALLLFGVFAIFLLSRLLSYWIEAYMCGADVTFLSLISMSLLKLEHRVIVTAKIMGRQSGLAIDRESGMSTSRLMSHQLAGGNVERVVRAMVIAQRAGLSLDFDRAAAIDLSGRDILQAVQTCVSPVVITCPRQVDGKSSSLSAVAKNGVEVLIRLKITVRTNLDQLIGGATEETIIARVGHAIIAAVGTAETHMEVLEAPATISQKAIACNLEVNTAYTVISIDVSDVELGENIGARLQVAQAGADISVAQARAEARRAEALARLQQMKAKVREAEAGCLLSEAGIPIGLSEAFLARPFVGNSALLSRYMTIRSAPRLPFETLGTPEVTKFSDLGR